MRVIELTCKCGAYVKLTDTRGSFINDFGKPDEKGRKFLIEVQADKWLDRHKKCYEAGR